MNPLQQLYDLKFPVAKAIAIYFARLQIKTYSVYHDSFLTPDWNATNPEIAGNILSTLDFQKARPRLQIAISTGAASGVNYPSSVNYRAVGGYEHDMVRALIVGLRVVTKANITEHSAFESLVRGSMATILRRINGDNTHADAIEGDQLALHRITALNESGSTETYQPEDDVYQTDLQFSGLITFQESAVAALET